MDNRRTPNNLKPPTTGSVSKWSRPRSLRKPSDPNSTFSSNPDLTFVGSARNLNRTVRQNLNATLCGPSHSRIKPAMPAAAVDLEVEYDLAYNEYLQALLKQQIIKKTVEEHRDKLNDQIFLQKEQQFKLQTTYQEITEKISTLKKQSEVVEFLDKLDVGVKEVNNISERYSVLKRLDQLSNILIEESNLISVQNIKPIKSQKEYDELISTLNSLNHTIEKILNSGRNFAEVHELAKSVKTFEQLRNNVIQSYEKNLELRKKASIQFFSNVSDMFAKQGGYY